MLPALSIDDAALEILQRALLESQCSRPVVSLRHTMSVTIDAEVARALSDSEKNQGTSPAVADFARTAIAEIEKWYLEPSVFEEHECVPTDLVVISRLKLSFAPALFEHLRGFTLVARDGHLELIRGAEVFRSFHALLQKQHPT
jgi:hypothetical protein